MYGANVCRFARANDFDCRLVGYVLSVEFYFYLVRKNLTFFETDISVKRYNGNVYRFGDGNGASRARPARRSGNRGGTRFYAVNDAAVDGSDGLVGRSPRYRFDCVFGSCRQRNRFVLGTDAPSRLIVTTATFAGGAGRACRNTSKPRIRTSQ
ncbi:MAG: hypothetical protein ACLUSP_05910 [Christensenellales bacterium]